MQRGDLSKRVEIFDQSYNIKGAMDDDYVEQLATYVDQKMREIYNNSRTVDTLKVAVMAALNIADELFQEQNQARQVETIIGDKSAQCSRVLDQLFQR